MNKHVDSFLIKPGGRYRLIKSPSRDATRLVALKAPGNGGDIAARVKGFIVGVLIRLPLEWSRPIGFIAGKLWKGFASA